MNRPRTILVMLSLVAILLAGCVGGSDDTNPPATPAGSEAPRSAPPVQTSETTGTVKGTVLNLDSLDPVAGARVTIVPVSGAPLDGTVAQNGEYVINEVPPGRNRVLFAAAGFFEDDKVVEVVAGEIHDVNIMLRPLPRTDPHHLTTDHPGKLGLGVAWWAEPPVVGCQAISVPPEELKLGPPLRTVKNCGGLRVGSVADQELFPSENAQIDFDAPNNTKTIIIEMAWDPAGPLGKYLSLDLSCQDVPTGAGGAVLDIDHPCFFDSDDAESPIVHRVDEAHWLEHGYNYTGNWRARVFATQGMLGTQDATGVDVGAAYEQAFFIYVTRFYNGPAPEGFTAIPDG